MDKTLRLALAGLIAVAGCLFGSGSSDAAVALWQQRMTDARDGRSTERLIEGKVRLGDETLSTPLGSSDAVAYAKWTQVRLHNSVVHTAENLQLEAVPFHVVTSDATLIVAGRLVGVSDLVHRVKGPRGDVEAFVSAGDHVSVLGELSERDGQTGFFGDFIVVKGTFAEWYAAVPRGTLPSIPDQP
jgi:hypothetical protein